jgi:hypothetical protein
MPANIALGAFIVGAILLLLAVSHGGFKIFGAEMSGAEGRAPRIVAGLCGALLIGFGAWQSTRSDASAHIEIATAPTSAGQAPAASPTTAAVSPEPASGAAPAPPVAPSKTLPVGMLSDSEDSVRIVDITPKPGSFFHRGTPQAFDIKLEYSVQSVDAGLMSISVDQIRDSVSQCAGVGHLTDIAQVPVERGRRTVDITVIWNGGSAGGAKTPADATGYLRFVPMLWRASGQMRGERIKIFRGLDTVCMRYGA